MAKRVGREANGQFQARCESRAECMQERQIAERCKDREEWRPWSGTTKRIDVKYEQKKVKARTGVWESQPGRRE